MKVRNLDLGYINVNRKVNIILLNLEIIDVILSVFASESCRMKEKGVIK